MCPILPFCPFSPADPSIQHNPPLFIFTFVSSLFLLVFVSCLYQPMELQLNRLMNPPRLNLILLDENAKACNTWHSIKDIGGISGKAISITAHYLPLKRLSWNWVNPWRIRRGSTHSGTVCILFACLQDDSCYDCRNYVLNDWGISCEHLDRNSSILAQIFTWTQR